MAKGKGFDKPTLSKIAKKIGVAAKHLRSLGWSEGEGEIHKRDGSTFRVTGCRVPYYRRAEEGDEGAIKLGDMWVVETFAKIRTSLEGNPKYLHEKPGEPGLYGEWLLDEYRQRPRPSLILVEGETDTAALASEGLPTAGIPGVDTVSKVLRADHLEGFDRLFIIREPGEGGKTFCANLAKHLPAIGWAKGAGPVTVVDLDGRDPAEMLCELQAGFLPAFRKACRDGVSLNRIASQGRAQGLIKCAADVKMKPTRFIQYPYLPVGYLTLLFGDAGLGKSRTMAAISSILSRQSVMDGADPEFSEPGNGRVLLFSGEDRADDTIVPRFVACGGDESRLFIVDPPEKGEGITFSDSEIIDEVARQVDPSLMIFDGMMDFWPPGISMNDQHAAGPILREICSIARRNNSALIVVGWSGKGNKESAMDMFFGSVAFRGVMRSGLVIQPASDDRRLPGVRRAILSQAKCTFGPEGPSLLYEINSDETDAIGRREYNLEATKALQRVGSFRWLGVVEETADQIAAEKSGSGEGRALGHAKQLIKEALKGHGEVALSVLDKVQQTHGVPYPTFFTARLDLGVFQRTDVSGEVYVWLPGEGQKSEDEDTELEQMVF